MSAFVGDCRRMSAWTEDEWFVNNAGADSSQSLSSVDGGVMYLIVRMFMLGGGPNLFVVPSSD